MIYGPRIENGREREGKDECLVARALQSGASDAGRRSSSPVCAAPKRPERRAG